MTLALEGKRWPWSLAGPRIESRGTFSGTVDARRRAGRWLVTGDAGLTDMVAIGDLIGSDTVHLDRAQVRWKIDLGDDTWTIEQLEVTSPVGSLSGQGSLPATPERSAWLDAKVDLAALARHLPATLRLRDGLRVDRGSAHLRAEVRANSQNRTQDWTVTGKISDLVARQGQKTVAVPEPATLQAMVRQGVDNLSLERLEIQTSFLTARGEGDVDHGIKVTGSIDLAAFRERFRDWIDLGPIAFAGNGQVEGRYQRHGEDFQAQATATFRKLRIEGMPLVGKVQRDLLALAGKAGGRARRPGAAAQLGDRLARCRKRLRPARAEGAAGRDQRRLDHERPGPDGCEPERRPPPHRGGVDGELGSANLVSRAPCAGMDPDLSRWYPARTRPRPSLGRLGPL